MARRKEANVVALQSWEDVDEAMRQIILADNTVRLQQVAFDDRVQEAKAELERGTRQAVEQTKLLGAQIKQFVTEHREELGGKKTRQLTFGQTGFRLSTKCVVPTGKSGDVLAALHKMGLADCIKVEEKIDKEALKQKPVAIVAQAGCRLETSDTWWFDVDHTKLPTTE